MFFHLSILLLLISPTFLLLTRAGKDTQRLVLKQKPRRSTGQYRRTLDANLVRQIQEEAVSQVLVQASDDYAEMKAAREEKREPKYRRR